MCKCQSIETFTCKSRFDCIGDHLILAYIKKVKLNQILQEFKDCKKSLVLIYVTSTILKKRDMILNDFLSKYKLTNQTHMK